MAIYNPFKDRPCRLPDSLINRDNVEITVNGPENRLNVEFSELISKEFAWWGRRKVDSLLYNVRTSLSYFLMHEPVNDSTIEIAYDLVFKDMSQVY